MGGESSVPVPIPPVRTDRAERGACIGRFHDAPAWLGGVIHRQTLSAPPGRTGSYIGEFLDTPAWLGGVIHRQIRQCTAGSNGAMYRQVPQRTGLAGGIHRQTRQRTAGPNGVMYRQVPQHTGRAERGGIHNIPDCKNSPGIRRGSQDGSSGNCRGAGVGTGNHANPGCSTPGGRLPLRSGRKAPTGCPTPDNRHCCGETDKVRPERTVRKRSEV